MPSTSSSTDLSRRERERQMRRRAMLDAAESVFAEKGYARATLDEIADRAEFGKGTLYNYFDGGKEEILYAIFDQTYEEVCGIIQDTFDGSPEGRSLRDRYHDLVVRGFQFYSEREDLLIILQKEAYRMAFSDDAERARYFHTWHQQLLSAALPAIERAIERGEIQDRPAAIVAHMLMENLDSLLVQRSLAKRAHETLDDCAAAPCMANDPTHAADILASMLFDGLAGGPAQHNGVPSERQDDGSP
jgi:AcrR family transcriptional regulator